MGSDEEATPPEGAPYPQLSLDYLRVQLEEQADRAARKFRDEAHRCGDRRLAAASRRKYWQRSRKKVVAETSQSLTSSEDEGSTMSEVDASSHKGQELPDWMSQLFEKLDLEVYDDGTCSSEKVAEVETYPNAEGGVFSEIHRSSHGNDPTAFEKLDLELNEDNICSTGKVTQEEAHPILEGGIPLEISRPLKGKDSTMAELNFGGLDEDEFEDWMLKMAKSGGYEYDECSLPEVDQEEEDLIHCDVPDEDMKTYSYKETIENGFKWMSEECFLAFTKSVEKFNYEGIELKFGELHSQCLSVVSYDKIFHHYNFTIEEKHRSSDVWTSKLYFAEVKQLSGAKIYFCCFLEPNDTGHCYGCKNQDMYDLKHPTRGGYEEGDASICWPFMDDPDSDDDCELGY